MQNKIINLIHIAIHAIIIVMGSVAIILQAISSSQSPLSEGGFAIFRYFTIDGNIFICVSSIVIMSYLIYAYIKKKDIPNYIYILHLMSAVSSLLIFLTVMVVLLPYYGSILLIGYIMIVLHATNPIIAVLSFLFLYKNKITNRLALLGIMPMAVYGIIAIILVASKVWTGNLIPYPFLKLYDNPWWQSVLYITSMFGGSALAGLLLAFASNKLYVLNYGKLGKTIIGAVVFAILLGLLLLLILI